MWSTDKHKNVHGAPYTDDLRNVVSRTTVHFQTPRSVETAWGFVLWNTSHVHFVFNNSIYDRKLYRSPGQVGCVVEGGGCEGRELALFQAIRWGSHPLVNYPSTLPPSPCGSLYFSSIYLYTCNILVWLLTDVCNLDETDTIATIRFD